MNKYIFRTLSLIALVIFCRPIGAVVNLELTKGVKKAIPIAILSFQGENASGILTRIINQDLSNSGEFNVIPSDRLPETPRQSSQINVAAWQKQHVNNLVMGQMNSGSVNFQLMDIYSSNPQNPILNQRFSTQ